MPKTETGAAGVSAGAPAEDKLWGGGVGLSLRGRPLINSCAEAYWYSAFRLKSALYTPAAWVALRPKSPPT